jgi:tetrahydromethanopterin S-methyltransferase subunit G
VAQETLEVQVAYLRGKVEEHSQGYADILAAIRQLAERVTFLDHKVDRFRDEMSGRIDALDQRLSGRIDALDQKVDRFRDELSGRIDALDQRLSGRIDALDQKVDRFRDELSGRIDALDQKVSRQFLWLMGVQVTVLLAVVGALIGALLRG